LRKEKDCQQQLNRRLERHSEWKKPHSTKQDSHNSSF